MEKSKNYCVLVKQVDRVSYEFSVSATSEEEAKGFVQRMLDEEPLDCGKNTFDNTDIVVEIIDSPIQVHTVEALFDIDKDITDEEVILLEDLSEKQRRFLGLVCENEAFRESGNIFYVFSSGAKRQQGRRSSFLSGKRLARRLLQLSSTRLVPHRNPKTPKRLSTQT